MQQYCKNFQGIIHNEYQPDKHKFSRVRCKMWQCPYCWRINQAQWRAALFKQLPRISKVWSFHTITLDGDLHRAHLTARRIRENWDKLMKRMKRMYGKFSYVRVLEQHQSGEWHIHLLASFHIPANDLRTVYNEDGSIKYQYAKTLKDSVFPETGFGVICSVSNIHPDESTDEGQVAKSIMYVTKYMTKRDDTLETAAKQEKIRIIQTSRDIKFIGDKADEVWTLKSGVYPDEILRGEVWVDLNKGGEVITMDHFKDSVVYPDDQQRPAVD